MGPLSSSKIKLFLRKQKFFKKYYIFLSLIKERLLKRIDNFRFNSYKNVFKNEKVIFRILDMGKVTRFRADLFEKKEPETLEWIDSFDRNDKFVDIGANVGVYSLYAASRKIKVIALEPDALNYALLNIKIRENNLNKFIIPYSIALNNIEKFSYFNISSIEWGGALNSFDNELDFKGEKFKPVHKQGVYGLPLDQFLTNIGLCPNHIKIDVDGNEFLVLKGGEKTFRSPSLQSVLIELDYKHMEYKSSLGLIESYGFKLHNIDSESNKRNGRDSRSTANHIFLRV